MSTTIANANSGLSKELELYYVEQLQNRIGSDRQTCRSLLQVSRWDVFRAEKLYNNGSQLEFSKQSLHTHLHHFEDVVRRPSRPAGPLRSTSFDASGGTIISNHCEDTFSELAKYLCAKKPSLASPTSSSSSSSSLYCNIFDKKNNDISSSPSSSPSSLSFENEISSSSSSSSSLKSQSSTTLLPPLDGLLIVYKNGLVWGDHVFLSFDRHFPQIRVVVDQLCNGKTPSLFGIPAGAKVNLKIIKKANEVYKVRPIPLSSSLKTTRDTFSSRSDPFFDKPFAYSSPSSSSSSSFSHDSLPTNCIHSFCTDFATDPLKNYVLGSPSSEDSRVVVVILLSGARLQVFMRESETIADLKYKLLPFTSSASSFVFSKVYPRVILSDLTQTIAGAGLHHSIVRLKYSI